MNRFQNVIFGQKAFIINSDKEILLLKRAKADIFSGMWDIPGGKFEEGDTLKQAIIREIKEETGLTLDKLLFCLSSRVFHGAANDKPLIMRNIYLCTCSGEVVLSEEHSEFKWIDAAEINPEDFPADVDLQKVIEILPEIVKTVDLNQESFILF